MSSTTDWREAVHSSETAEHYTPAAIVEAARLTLGGIDLDPASSEAAQRTVRAAQFHTAKSNGFTRPWAGRVFLNPPGGKCDEQGNVVRLCKGEGYFYADETLCEVPILSSAKAWWAKLVHEYLARRVEAAVFVGFTLEILQTTQVDPAPLLPLDCPLCVPSRRVAYVRADGTVGASPPHGSVIVCVTEPGTDYARRFAEAFAPLGRVRL